MKTTKVTPAQANQIVKLISIDLQNKSIDTRSNVCFQQSTSHSTGARTMNMYYQFMTGGSKPFMQTHLRQVLNGKQFKSIVTNCPLRFLKHENRLNKRGQYIGQFYTVDYAALVMDEKGRELLALAQQDAETNLSIA